MDIEFCIDSIDGALIALEYKIKRIELCSSLEVGGLTPEIELIEKCAAIQNLETHVMIRPRAGNFNYNSIEFTRMQQNIIRAKNAGAYGIVFGCLNKNQSIDTNKNKELIAMAKHLEMQATFHRAFDDCIDPIKSLDKLIELGFDRILTSGQMSTAYEGISLIKKLVLKSEDQIEIMAGSGVTASNANTLKKTGIHALHFTVHKKHDRETSQIDKEKIDSIFEVIF